MDDTTAIKKKLILDGIKNSEFIRNMQLEFLTLTDEDAVGRIPFRSGILNPYGSVHGGYLYALADTVAGSLAAMTGNYCTTTDGSMNFFSPAVDTEYLYCYAHIVRNGGHLVNVGVEIKNDAGKILDDGSFNYFKLKDNKVVNQ